MIAPQKPNTKPKKGAPAPTASQPDAMRVHKFVWGFGVVMVLIAGGGFGFKLYEFIVTYLSDEPFQFAIFPVVTYLMVAAGFGCLFMWAYLAGQFRNIESAKFRMLQMQAEMDETGTITPPVGTGKTV